MIKRLAVFLILFLLLSPGSSYFLRQLDWQKFGTLNYFSQIPEYLVFAPPPRIKILAVGDLMFDRGVYKSIERNKPGDFSFIFEKILDLKKDYDILLGNLEGPVTNQGQEVGNLYSFRMKPELLPVLKENGFDILSVANNHTGDWGYDGFVDTLKNLDANGLSYVGGGFNYASATSPRIINRNGLRTGFLGFSDVGPLGLAVSNWRAGVLIVKDADFAGIIKNAASQVDNLIVTIHFGEEYKTTHNTRQAKIAHEAIEAGARVVIGHHPHVVQDDEYYNNGYIAYSLGNFVFDQNFSSETMQGLALGLELGKDGVANVEKRPIKLNNNFQPSFLNSSSTSLR
jgi:gamma-polyglutamate biosynthesis protein CapA